MSWTTKRKSCSLPVQNVSSARSNVFLWLWINIFFPWKLSSRGNFKILPFHCGCEWVLVLFQFPWQQENLFSDSIWIQKSNFPGLFEFVSLHFYPLKCFEPLSLTPWLHLVLWNPISFSLVRTDRFFSIFSIFFRYNLIPCADSRIIVTFYTEELNSFLRGTITF